MAKLTLKEKEMQREMQSRKESGYKDFWYLLLTVGIVWLLETPAIVGLLGSDTRSHFHSYGVFMIFFSVVGFLTAVLLLALNKKKASIIISCTSAAFILLICALIYVGYKSALNTSDMNVAQIIVSYVTPLAVPVANIIMVTKRK